LQAGRCGLARKEHRCGEHRRRELSRVRAAQQADQFVVAQSYARVVAPGLQDIQQEIIPTDEADLGVSRLALLLHGRFPVQLQHAQRYRATSETFNSFTLLLPRKITGVIMDNGVRLSFTVPGVVRGKQRAGRKRLPGGKVLTFNPHLTASNEKLVRDYATVQMRRRGPLAGPIRLTISVYMAAPKSWSRLRREKTQYAIGRTDCDNLAKTVMDAIQGTVMRNDAQVAELIVTKRYARNDETRTHIQIEALEVS
jgi:Holliday junction resolvase RusA-like endonuclease